MAAGAKAVLVWLLAVLSYDQSFLLYIVQNSFSSIATKGVLMLWSLIGLIGGGTFVFNGIGVIMDSNCDTVSLVEGV
jgi:hypothetical protein